MEKARSKDGTEIAFERIGDGPTAIIVGGALNDRMAGVPFAQVLSSKFTAVTYDRRGRGDSGDTQPFAVEREVEDLGAVIDANGGSASLVGTSSGAVLGLVGAAAGLHVRKLAMYEPPFMIDDTRPVPAADYVDTLRERGTNDRGGAVEYFMTVGVGVPPEMVEGMKQGPMWPALEAIAHTLWYDGLVMGETIEGDPGALKQWASVQTPTLVMDGGASPPWLQNGARTLAEILPNAEYRTLEGQTHAVDPNALGPVVIEFFSD
jgi:pimeloyl-ACP methyl ester carboxylesterase